MGSDQGKYELLGSGGSDPIAGSKDEVAEKIWIGIMAALKHRS
jgi:hypothetical protein